LAPDIKEALLFLPGRQGVTERIMRPIVMEADWERQGESGGGWGVGEHGTIGDEAITWRCRSTVSARA